MAIVEALGATTGPEPGPSPELRPSLALDLPVDPQTAKEPLPTPVPMTTPSVETQPSAPEGTRREPSRAIRVLSAILKALVSILLGCLGVPIAMIPVLRYLLGLSYDSDSGIYFFLLLLSMIGGTALGAIFLRKRSWIFILVFGGLGLILTCVLNVLLYVLIP